MSPPDTPAADHPPDRETAECPVVGIGASAGGLEALTALIKTFTVDSMALVVLQHLAPDHESMLPAILARSTPMTVVSMTDGMHVEPNHLYVAPPNASVAILHGVLHLMSPAAPLPIDHFFRSLAEDQGQKAIGIVLSGLGSDGTLGLREIKARGGLAFCQDPATAKFDSMPRSALESGVVDRALPPEGIATELTTIGEPPVPRAQSFRDSAPRRAGRHGEALHPASFGLRQRSDLLQGPHDPAPRRPAYGPQQDRAAAGLRAICARESRGAGGPLPGHPHRRHQLLPGQRTVRAGQEAHLPAHPRAQGSWRRHTRLGACLRVGRRSVLARDLLFEVLERTAHRYRIQIFGTDVDGSAIARARRGAYPLNIEADVSATRLERFFVKVGKEYQVSHRLRDAMVFSEQNVAKDSPFSRIDLVSCRNLLIYLQPAHQKKVLRLLHYALNPDGYLLLGTSETVGDCADVFSLVDRKNKIYIRKNLPLPVTLNARSGFGVDDAPAKMPETERHAAQSARRSSLPIGRCSSATARPACWWTKTSKYCSFAATRGRIWPASGNATLNLLKLLRPELHVEVWRALQQVLKNNAPARIAAIRLPPREGDVQRTVGVEVLPIHDRDTQSRCMLVVFEESAASAAPVPSSGERSEDEATARTRELERDLASTKEYLQATIEELETGNEELKSTNEELQSTNEELQSTNEELETSKEELQSTNEELSTMNDELQHRMVNLGRSNSNLDNLLRYMQDPVLFVDSELRLRRVSEAAQTLLRLGAAGLGRSLAELRAPSGREPGAGRAQDDRAADVERRAGPREGALVRAPVVPYRGGRGSSRGRSSCCATWTPRSGGRS